MAKLSKAPVFYAVAQVIHSPILKLSALIPDLQDQLRKEGYPGYRESRHIGFEVKVHPVNLDGPEMRQKETVSHIFTSRDSTQSIVVKETSISYQTVEYGSIDSFGSAVAKALRVASGVLMPDSYTRIGMRILDAVVPPEGEDISIYMRPEFLGLVERLDDDWFADYTFAESAFTRNGRRLKSRVITRSQELEYPVDLFETAPPIPERFKEINGVHALIDSDAILGGAQGFVEEFDVDAIVDHLKVLKEDLSLVFKAVVTDKALEDWS